MRIHCSTEHTLRFVDAAALKFLAVTTHRLNGALKDSGVADSQKRQEICTSFLFNFAYQHDAGWLISSGTKVFPQVVFAERALAKPDEDLGQIEDLHIPTQNTSWHEYAVGVVTQYFEEDGETVPGVQTGNYDNADEVTP